MSFLSITFALFLLSVVGLYWILQRERLQLWFILLVSLVFYLSQFLNIPYSSSSSDFSWVRAIVSLPVIYLGLLIGLVSLNFYLGLVLSNYAKQDTKGTQAKYYDVRLIQGFWQNRQNQILVVGISINVLFLLGFKYIPFFLYSVAGLLNSDAIKFSGDWFSRNLIAPLGISFFCFECIAYLIDVYRGAPATRDWLKFSAYKWFFPKLISGPITRYHYFASQVGSNNHITGISWFIEGLWLITSGAVKKALIADRLGVLVDLSFGNLERAGSGDLWLAIVAYGLQLYLDFSGYVDMARGIAMLLGFNLPPNFDFPYMTTNIADFWRKWHMTLGDWLRNYLYFPLGGSRQGLARTCLNLMIIMVVCGLWHGAGWGFVLWGFLHGVALVIHRLNDKVSDRFEWLKFFWISIPGLITGWFITQLTVFLSWIFLRIRNFSQAMLVWQNLWGHQADPQFADKVYNQALGLQPVPIAILLGLIIVAMMLLYLVERGLKLQVNWPIKLLLVPLGLYSVWMLAVEGGLPYIYFDF